MLHKALKILAIIIGVVALVLGIWLFISDNVSLIAPMLTITYIVFGLILFLVLIFVIRDLLKGDIKKTLISVGVFAAIVLIAYFMSSGTEVVLNNGDTLTVGESKWIGAGLRTFYFLAAIAIGAMIFSGVKKLSK
ncbi:hypothetical protein [Mesonia sp. K7]|uniref:hypothetical protein n=1 Tax=Mesonia sp. K7 TaxID=2218606 RepID=UPI001F1E6AE7|nr:hypothetical protein [Mesonia sp. K7]